MIKWLQRVVAPVTAAIEGYQARKLAEQEAEATVERILTEAAANDASVAGQIALINAKNQNNTWKDEYGLIVATGPFVLAMLAGAGEVIGLLPPGTSGAVLTAMLSPLEKAPEWWTTTFQVAIWSALGITGLKKLTK